MDYQANPREDFERARRLYDAYQQHRASGAATPFQPDPDDVAAFQRTHVLYQDHQRRATPATSAAVEPEEEQGFGDALVEGGKEFMLGLGETGTNLVRGVGALGRQAGLLDAERGLTDLVEGNEGTSGLERWADETEAQMREVYDPDDDARYARLGGRILGEGAAAIGGSKVILAGLSKMPATAKLASRIALLQRARAGAKAGGLARGAAMLKRIGGQVAPVVPLDIAIGAGQAQEGESALGRGLEEVAYDVGGTGVFDALGTALRAAKLSRLQKQRAGREPRVPAASTATTAAEEATAPFVAPGATPELATLSRKASEILDRGALVTSTSDADVLRRTLDVGGERLDPSLRQRIEYHIAEVGDGPTGYPTHDTPAGGTLAYERWDNNAPGQPARLVERGDAAGGAYDGATRDGPVPGPAAAADTELGRGRQRPEAVPISPRGVDGGTAGRAGGAPEQRASASAGGTAARRGQAAAKAQDPVDLFSAPPSGGASRPLSTIERSVAAAESSAEDARRANTARADAGAAAAAPGVVLGREAPIKAESGQAPARYAAVPADRVIASHNPVTIGDFAPNRLHPGNERGYGRGTAQREGVVRNALRWDADRVLNNNPTPAEGPPMVAPWTRELADEYGVPWAEVEGTFFALGGNSRVMTQQLMAQSGKAGEVSAAVAARATQFGLDPRALPADPMVVRIVDDVRSRADVERLVRQFNETGTKALSQEESAVTFGARISDDTMRYLGEVLDPERTILAALQDATVTRELRSRFLQDGVIDPATRDRYFTRLGTLTDEGKLFVKSALLGRAVPDREVLQTAAPSMVDKIERVAASIAMTARAGAPYDLRPALTEVLRRQSGKPLSLDTYLSQLDMLDTPTSEQVQSLWLALDELPAKDLRERMARYAEVLQKRVVRDVDPTQAGFDLGAALPPPTPREAWDAAFVQMPDTPTFTTMGEAAEGGLFAGGGAYAGSLLGGLQGVKPELARWLVRGTLGGVAGLASTNEDIDPKARAALMLAAVVLGGPPIRKALARTGLHPGEALWRIIGRGGAATKEALFRRINGAFGEGEAYRVMQFLSYEYGLPEWLSRARIAREVGTENATRKMIDFVRRDLVEKLSAGDREKVTGIVRQVEQRRGVVTQEIERLQGMLYEVRTKGPGALQQSNLFRPTDPTDGAGLLSALQQQRTLRDTETARAWLDQAAHPLAAKAKKLVELEDQLSDQLIAEGYDPAIFERFRGTHLTRAFEKYLDPERAPEGLADGLRDPMAAGATRDPAYWSVARQDLPPDVLKDLGEINDAAVLFAKGQSDKLHSLFTRRYFNELLSGFAGDGLPMMAGKPVKASYIQLPSSPALGPLAGKYAHPSIAHSLLATYGPQGHASQLWRAWKRTSGKVLGWWKAGKTAWSPWTQARNVMSNAVMLHLSGMDLFDPRSWGTLTKAMYEYRSKGKLYQEAADAGVFRGSFWKSEVEDLFNAWNGVGAGAPITRLAALAGTAPKLQRALRKPSDYYEAVEHVFKLAKFAHERSGGANAGKAADEAVRTLFDYSAVPGWVRLYRSSLIGAPFFTFSYKAVPRMAEWTLKHPDKVASLMAVFALVETLGGEDEPLPEVAPELVHPWLRPYVQLGKDNPLGKPGMPFTGRQSLQLPFKTEKGQAMASLDFLLPSGSAVPDAPTAEGGLWEAIPPALRPGNPLGTLPFELLRNRALYSNKPIRTEAAARDGEASNLLRYYLPYLMRQLAPGALQLAVDYNADEGVKPGLAVSAAMGDLPASAFAAQLAGVKPAFMDPKRSALIETQKLDRAADEVTRQARRELFRSKQEGRLDAEKRRSVREGVQARRRVIQAERRAILEALRRAREAGY